MALCGVAFMFANSVSAQSAKQGIVTVVRIQGEARYSVGDNVWHPLIAGKTLAPGAVIQTAVDSTVDIVLGTVPVQVAYPNSAFPTPAQASLAADPNVRGYVVYNPKVSQNVIRMYGNTVLAIDKLTFSDTGADVVGDTELDLRAGKIFGSVKKLSAMSEFEVKIPNGVAGIRGTSFFISADGTVTVTKGSVMISYASSNGTTTTITLPGSNGEMSYTPNVGYSSNPEGNVVPNDVGVIFSSPMVFVDNGVKVHVSPICGKSSPPI